MLKGNTALTFAFEETMALAKGLCYYSQKIMLMKCIFKY
jgi:hypothetical protein